MKIRKKQTPLSFSRFQQPNESKIQRLSLQMVRVKTDGRQHGTIDGSSKELKFLCSQMAFVTETRDKNDERISVVVETKDLGRKFYQLKQSPRSSPPPLLLQYKEKIDVAESGSVTKYICYSCNKEFDSIEEIRKFHRKFEYNFQNNNINDNNNNNINSNTCDETLSNTRSNAIMDENAMNSNNNKNNNYIDESYLFSRKKNRKKISLSSIVNNSNIFEKTTITTTI